MKQSLLLLALIGSVHAFSQPKNPEKRSEKKSSKVLVISDGDTTTIDLSKMAPGVDATIQSLPKIEVKEVKENGKTFKTISVISSDKSLNMDSLLKTIRIESDSPTVSGPKKMISKEIKVIASDGTDRTKIQIDSTIKVIVMEGLELPAPEKLDVLIDGKILGTDKIIKIKSIDGNFDLNQLNLKNEMGEMLIFSDTLKWVENRKTDNKIVLYLDGDTTEFKLPKKK